MVKFLSYVLNEHTPTYGNRNKLEVIRKSSIKNGDSVNESLVRTTTHVGTHLDMPYHFYENGQDICDFGDDFWVFNNVKVMEVEPKNLIIEKELIMQFDELGQYDCDLLIVKTNACGFRDSEVYWNNNYGFSPKIYDVLIKKMPNLRVFGFDSISVSSFNHRDIGKIAHKTFLNPTRPILLLEDMDLRSINKNTKLQQVVLAPMRIEKCDGLPCSVIGFFND